MRRGSAMSVGGPRSECEQRPQFPRLAVRSWGRCHVPGQLTSAVTEYVRLGVPPPTVDLVRT